MIVRTELVVPYSIILLAGKGNREIPELVDGQLIVTTPTCIAIGCRADVDGATSLTLGDQADVMRSQVATYRGVLETPTRVVLLQTVEEQHVLEMQVDSARTVVTIWANHPYEPDDIVIGLE